MISIEKSILKGYTITVEYDNLMPGDPEAITRYVRVEVRASGESKGVNVSASGTMAPEGVQALKDAIAVAEIIYRNGGLNLG